MTIRKDTCDGLEISLEKDKSDLELPPGVPPLLMFYLYLSAGCNLHCRHCWITPSFIDGEPVPAECLDIELIKDAVLEAKALGLASVKLTGGEPVLHPEFARIADFLSEQELSLTMETNGTLIDRSLARHLRDKTRLFNVAVSLDSHDPDWHDRFRGRRGAFDAAVRGVKHLVEAGFRPQVIMSVMRENVEHVESLIALAVSLGAGSVKFNPVLSLGRGADFQRRGLLLSIDEVVALKQRIRGPIQERYGIYLGMMLPPALMTVKEILRHGGSGGACHVRNILGLLGTGEMALCGIGRNVPELCFGKLGRDSVREVWFTNPTLIQMRRDLEGALPGLCGDCIHAKGCLTHCLAMNFEATGRLVDTSPICTEAQRLGLFPEGRRKKTASKG